MTSIRKKYSKAKRQIGFRIQLARLALLWESVWGALWPLVSVAGLFVAVSLAGLWQLADRWYHVAGLSFFAAILVVLCWQRFPLISWPTRKQGRRRLETDSGVDHRPLQLLEDDLVRPNNSATMDKATQHLWALSKRRALQTLSHMHPGLPRPNLALRDQRALRFAVGLCLFVGLMAAGSDGPNRLARAFTPDLRGPVAAVVFEAWVTPPAYTGKAPVLLTAHGKSLTRTNTLDVEDGVSGTEQPVISVPVNSVLFVRHHGGNGLPTLALDDSIVQGTAIDAQNNELTVTLDQARSAALMQDAKALASWTFAVIPDEAPQAAFEDEPTVSIRQALKIAILATDDYGLVGLKLSLAHKGKVGQDIAISVPPHSPDTLRRKLFQDFTPHKWAGLPVAMTLTATDGAGQEGRSQVLNITLPEREFEHPVAKAVIEQRRHLASEEQTRQVARALRVISMFPEEYDNDTVVALSLRAAIRRLELNRTDKIVDEVIDILWDTALRIEDGVLSIAERALRRAEQNLMDALSRNATQEELDRLTQELKQAMDRFLQAMMEDMAKNGVQQSNPNLPVDPNAQVIDRQSLQDMLERARELSKLGAKDAARELLSQLRNMLENLNAGMRQQQMSPRTQAGQKALGEIGKLMRRQQELMDQAQQRQQSGEAKPDDKQSSTSAAEQEGLRKRLGEIMRQLGDARGKIPQQMGKAERSMRGAGKSLQKGQPGQAVPQQGNALQQMRAGAEALAKAMAGERGRQGMTGQRPRPAPGRNTDPLGRPYDAQAKSTDGGDTKIPDKGAIQRARKVLKELHERASDVTRPKVEREYLDRLLKRF